MTRMLFVLGITAAFLFSAFVPPSSAISEKIVPLPLAFIGHIFSGKEVSPSRRVRPLTYVSDSSFSEPLEYVAWATKRKDLRACADIPAHPSHGDLLTLCIATVQDDAERCDRIESRELARACHEVVAL